MLLQDSDVKRGPVLEPDVCIELETEQVVKLCAGAWCYKDSHMHMSCFGLALSRNFSHFCTEREV